MIRNLVNKYIFECEWLKSSLSNLKNGINFLEEAIKLNHPTKQQLEIRLQYLQQEIEELKGQIQAIAIRLPVVEAVRPPVIEEKE